MKIEVTFKNGYPVMTPELHETYTAMGSTNVLVTFEKIPMKHSDAQRNYFHGVIVKYFQELWREIKGFFHESIVKAVLKQKFLKKEHICEITGEVFQIVRDTRDLNISEYDLFIQQCRFYYQYETGEEIPFTSYYRGKEL